MRPGPGLRIAGAEASDQYERARLAIGKSEALYFDFNVLGPKCGPILLAHVVRAAPKRIKYVGGSTARGRLLSVLPLGLGW
jgi:hypothetical protein